MIKIKAFFGEPREVDENKAIQFILSFMDGIRTCSTYKERAALTDGKHLFGVTVDELLQGCELDEIRRHAGEREKDVLRHIGSVERLRDYGNDFVLWFKHEDGEHGFLWDETRKQIIG